MTQLASIPIFSTKRLLLCSREAEARALDGDKVSVDLRLLGVDAFERKQLCQRDGARWACGKAAQDLAARQVGNASAAFTLTPDETYGRPVATVTVGRGPWRVHDPRRSGDPRIGVPAPRPRAGPHPMLPPTMRPSAAISVPMPESSSIPLSGGAAND